MKIKKKKKKHSLGGGKLKVAAGKQEGMSWICAVCRVMLIFPYLSLHLLLDQPVVAP